MVLFTIPKIIYKIQLKKFIKRNLTKKRVLQEQFKIWFKNKSPIHGSGRSVLEETVPVGLEYRYLRP